MNQYPAKPLMDQMAGYGRYGDSMLVHMNPVEVAGIASLSPTGKLTTNPVTGQPEAFLLAPLLGAIGGALNLGVLGSAALSGIGTAALTGDLTRGALATLSGGIMSQAGDLIGGFFDSGAEAAADTVLEASAEAGLDAATSAPIQGLSAVNPDVLQSATNSSFQASQIGLPGAEQGLSSQMSSVGAQMSPLSPTPEPSGISGLEAFSNKLDTAVGNLSLGQSALIAGGAMGQEAQMDFMDEQAKQARRLEQESEEKLKSAYGDLQGAYAMAQPGIQTGTSPYRGMMSSRTPPPFAPGGMAAGGIVSLAEGGTTDASSIEPTEEEARVLALAKTTPALSPANQRILEGYYNRVNQVAQQNVKTAALPEDAIPLQDGVLKIPDGATNKEALDTLYGYGLINKADYDWFSGHLRATDAEGGKYLASGSFPGLTEYLSQNQFDEPQVAQVTRILSALDKASSEEGIAEEDLNYLTEGQITEFSTPYNAYGFGYGGGYNSGYGGIDPVSVQAALRADYNVAAPMDYMAGFEPEFQYFQQDPNNILVPTRAFRPTKAGVRDTGEYFDPILDREAYLEQLRDYYSRLAGFTPAEVTPAESTTPIEDTPSYTEAEQPTAPPATAAPPATTAPLPTFEPNLPNERRPVVEPVASETVIETASTPSNLPTALDINTSVSKPPKPPTATAPANTPWWMTEKGYALLQEQDRLGVTTGAQQKFLKDIQSGNQDFVVREEVEQDPRLTFQEGGPVPARVPLQTSMGEMDVAAGGIADMPSNYSKQPMPSEREVQMVAKAILGRVLDPDSIITAFVETYGTEAFRQLREMVLQSVVPNAQTEGMIRGSGGGMDDQVNGMIGSEQPVAVSPGEYIVPADVVSGLGDGSSDAGAAELDQMLSRVRMARGGNAEQAPAIDARKTMPA